MIGRLGKKVEVIWMLFEDERKYGKTQSNTWKCDCVFWGRLMMERIWWKQERLALGLGMFECTIWKCFLALLPSCWFFFWDTYISNFVSNVLVTWGETSSPQSASMNWSVVFLNQFHLRQFLWKDIFEVEWIKSQQQSRSSEWQLGGYRCTSWQLFWCSKNNRFKVKEDV